MHRLRRPSATSTTRAPTRSARSSRSSTGKNVSLALSDVEPEGPRPARRVRADGEDRRRADLRHVPGRCSRPSLAAGRRRRPTPRPRRRRRPVRPTADGPDHGQGSAADARRSGRSRARRRGRASRSRRMPPGRRPPTAPTRSRSSRSRPRPGSRTSSRSATGGWRSRRSRSTAGRRCRWPPTWRRRRRAVIEVQALRRRPPLELRPVRVAGAGAACSTSTTSTRRCPDRSEWDLKRLAASLVVAGRERGLHRPRQPPRRPSRASAPTGRGWPSTPRCARSTSTTRGWTPTRSRPTSTSAPGRSSSRPWSSAAHHDALHELPKLTELGDGGVRRIVDHPPVDHPSAGADGAHRGHGPGRPTATPSRRTAACSSTATDSWTPRSRSSGSAASASARSWRCLDDGSGDDPLFLQAKEAEASVLERFLGAEPPRQPRRARRHRPAPAPGGQRRAARLDDRAGRAPLLRPPAPGPEGDAPSSTR